LLNKKNKKGEEGDRQIPTIRETSQNDYDVVLRTSGGDHEARKTRLKCKVADWKEHKSKEAKKMAPGVCPETPGGFCGHALMFGNEDLRTFCRIHEFFQGREGTSQGEREKFIWGGAKLSPTTQNGCPYGEKISTGSTKIYSLN